MAPSNEPGGSHPEQHFSSFEGASGKWKLTFASAAVVSQITPINELVRAPFVIGSQIIDPGPLSGALAGGVSTAVVEGAAVVGAAELLSSKTGSKAMGRVNEVINRLIPEKTTLSKLLEAGLLIVGGSVVAMIYKQRELEHRNPQAYRRYGYKAAAFVAGYVSVLGGVAGAGIESPSPTTIGAAVGTLTLLGGAHTWAKRQLSQPQTQ